MPIFFDMMEIEAKERGDFKQANKGTNFKKIPYN